MVEGAQALGKATHFELTAISMSLLELYFTSASGTLHLPNIINAYQIFNYFARQSF